MNPGRRPGRSPPISRSWLDARLLCTGKLPEDAHPSRNIPPVSFATGIGNTGIEDTRISNAGHLIPHFPSMPGMYLPEKITDKANLSKHNNRFRLLFRTHIKSF